MTTTTTQMGLKIPDIGDPSPGYVNDLRNSLLALDTHDHSSGKGAQITQAGLNITGALPMGGQTVSNARSVLLAPQGSPLVSAADNGSLFVSGVDLYYLDGNNTLVRLTTGGRNAGAIGGDYPNFPLAQVSYSNPDLTYYFRDGANAFAKINALSLALGTSSATSYKIVVSDPGPGTGFRFGSNVGNQDARMYCGDVSCGVVSASSVGATTFSGTSLSLTGTSTAGNFSTTGGLTTGSVAASGTVQAATITATGSPGTVNGNNLIITGSTSLGTVTASGNVAVGSLNATGGVLQGSRIIALRGVVKASTLTANGTYPINAFVDGATPAWAQTTFTSPYAGSIAALTARAYGAAPTNGTIALATSGLSVNATSGTPWTASTTVLNGAAVTFTPGTFTFNAGVAFTVNVTSSGYVQSTSGATGVDVTAWVYC